MDKISSMNAFIKVAESSSFSQAATQLGVGSGAVTRSISSLERRLGVKLMERTTRKVSLTPAGEAYLECCKNVLGMIETAEYEIGGHSIELTGLIRVGLSNLHGNRLFGPLLTKFARINPGIKFDLTYFDLYNHFTSSEVDIAFLISDEKRKLPESLSLGVIQMQLLASPDYLSRYGQVTHPVDLLRHRCLNLSPQPSRPVWQFVENGVMTDYVVNACLNTRNGDGLLQAALDGLGIACLPSEIAVAHLKSGALETVLDEFPLAPLEASIALAPSKLASHRTKALVAFASTEFAYLP